jgi:ABC-type branched-subunit amino acid transport system substrate-binding protein
VFQKRTKLFAAAVAATTVMVAAGCSSSSKNAGGSSTTSAASTGGTTASSTGGSTGSAAGGSTGSAAGGGTHTYTIGVLNDQTGLTATDSRTFVPGVKAGILQVAKEDGYTIKYVLADTGSTPTGALAAAQKLVDEDHVFAVLAYSGATFGAEPFLKSKGIPVIGANIDASEWTTAPNMFSVAGTSDYHDVFTQTGLQFKGLGATNIAAIGYSVSPSSSDTAKSNAASAQLAGLKVGYLNANFPLGGTNAGPAVLAMKAAGIDGLAAPIDANTEFAVVKGLRQEGVNLKVVLASTGYGGDLIQGGPDAQQIAQGIYFLLGEEPVEMHTPATEAFSTDIKAVGIAGEPTTAEMYGYMSVDALVQGIKAAGSNPTQASVISDMLQMHNYNGAGLFGTHSVSFALADRGKVSSAENCNWITQYEGTTFKLVPGMDPICGTTVPGKTVS